MPTPEQAGAFDYYVVPFIGHVKRSEFTAEGAQEVAKQLQTVIDHYVSHGWEFHSVEKVGIVVQPGCLAMLFGYRAHYLNFDQIVFRRAR